MCGDTHCCSCGPAQGNGRCETCGAWADDIAEMFQEGQEPDEGDFFLAHEQWHIEQDGGPERIVAAFQAEADAWEAEMEESFERKRFCPQ